MNNKVVSLIIGCSFFYGPFANAATPTSEEVAKLIANDAAASDYLGYTAAVDGDTAVVGAYGDDDLGSESGSAYVFTRNSSGDWSLQQKLTASDGASNDRFGWVVAIDGDTVVVGNESWDFFNPPPGAAYVFTRNSSGVWSEQQKLTAYDGAAGDHFGEAVSVNGNTIVIGAYGDDDGVTGSGSAYVYTSDSAGNWSLQQKLNASNGAANGGFGRWLDVEGNTVVIAASKFDNSGTVVDTGSGYVFSRDSSGIWSEQQSLLPNDPASNSAYGSSVAISGDNIVIGAWGDDQTDVNAGAAYVFSKNSAGIWNQQQKLVASDATAGDYFGMSVDIDGNNLVVGAYGDDANKTDAGSVYAFTKNSAGIWTETAKLLASDGQRYDYMASATRSVGITSTTVIAGARLDDTSAGTNTGSAYVFELTP